MRANVRHGGPLRAATVAPVALVLLTVGPAGASGPITEAAPYPHAVAATYNYLATSGCVSIFGHRAHWLPFTGIGHLSIWARSMNCSRTLPFLAAGSYAYGLGQSTASVPIHTFAGRARATSVEVDWNVTMNATGRVTVRGSCPTVAVNPSTGNGSQYCDDGTQEIVGAGAYLVDATNGSVFAAANPWSGLDVWTYDYNDTFCSAFSCVNYNASASSGGNVSGTLRPTFWINASLDHADQYGLVTWVAASGYSYVDGWSGATITSALNLASRGGQFELERIVVT